MSVFSLHSQYTHSTNLGINFLVAPNANLQDGLLDISVYPDFSKAELLRYYAITRL
jgi:diacylglycerol kinase family enzyme